MAVKDKNKARYSQMLVLRNRMMFVLLDMVQLEMTDVENEAQKCGYTIDHEMKRAWNAIKHNTQIMCRKAHTIDESEQLAIGNTSDLFRLFIWRIVSNCMPSADRLFKTYNAVKNMYSGNPIIDLSDDEKNVLTTLTECMAEKSNGAGRK